MKAFVVAVAAWIAAPQACAQSLHIAGTAGYLSEWSLDGEVAENNRDAGNEQVGWVIWKHVGLCSVSDPQEKRGAIRIRLSKSGPSHRLNAIFSLDDRQCTFKAQSSGTFSGYLDCSSKGALIPVSISVK